MFKIDHKKAQAATELAVFGAILIFLLGTIVRSAAGNSYTQNQNFKAMRMAMLASWNGSEAGNTAHNSASILFVEDRLSPDLNKYGDVDRNPYIAQGSGSFTYELMYPVQAGDVASNIPIMDMYINGAHFPFTTASWVPNKTITRSMSCSADCPSAAATPQQQQCVQDQVNRNQREWVGGAISASQFEPIIQGTIDPTTITNDAVAIFQELAMVGLISAPCAATTPPSCTIDSQGTVPAVASQESATMMTTLSSTYPSITQAQLNAIPSILQSGNSAQYKLFYTQAPNPAGTGISSPFSTMPPVCANPNTLACKDKALSSTLQLMDASGTPFTNTNGEMQYDLLRTGNYLAVDTAFPVATTSAGSMRNNIAWQWAATAATTQGDTTDGAAPMIGLDPDNNQYPTYDVDGRLKEVTIYSMSQNPDGSPMVSYEDFQGGDIDTTWDTNSCGPKPGLQNDAQIYTFTKDGTYLQIKEGGEYNPETGQFVRSVNKRDTIDLIQRMIQLSNNTGDFCNGTTPQTEVNGSPDKNPVETCVDGKTCNCFIGSKPDGTPVNPACGITLVETCEDTSVNMIYVRSRLEDRRGRFWLTNASGQLQVK